MNDKPKDFDTFLEETTFANRVPVGVKKLHPRAITPVYATSGAAGADIHSCLDEGAQAITVPARGRAIIPTGIGLNIPPFLEVQVRPRSGLAAKFGLTVLNAPGTIDNDYKGEIKVILINHSDKDYHVNHGERIAQLVLAPSIQMRLDEADDLGTSVRNEGGFGSTGQ